MPSRIGLCGPKDVVSRFGKRLGGSQGVFRVFPVGLSPKGGVFPTRMGGVFWYYFPLPSENIMRSVRHLQRVGCRRNKDSMVSR